jgi:hypothetical protein
LENGNNGGSGSITLPKGLEKLNNKKSIKKKKRSIYWEVKKGDVREEQDDENDKSEVGNSTCKGILAGTDVIADKPEDSLSSLSVSFTTTSVSLISLKFLSISGLSFFKEEIENLEEIKLE